jgi:hypothetical protein
MERGLSMIGKSPSQESPGRVNDLQAYDSRYTSFPSTANSVKGKSLPNTACTRTAGFTPPKWLFSWLQVLSVSWASLVPPAAGNASR